MDAKQIRSLKIGAAVLMAVTAGTILYFQFTPRSKPYSPPMAYYWDTASDQLFVALADVPPIAAPSGKTDTDGRPVGVLAHAFSCGNCDNETERFVLYLETVEPGTKEAMTARPPGGGPPPTLGGAGRTMGRLIARFDARTKWVPAESAEGAEITAAVMTSCDGKAAKSCTPSGG